MKKISLIAVIAPALLLTACGGGAKTTTHSVQSPVYSNTDNAKINCVARDGFLVPVKGGFVCRMPNGQSVSLANL